MRTKSFRVHSHHPVQVQWAIDRHPQTDAPYLDPQSDDARADRVEVDFTHHRRTLHKILARVKAKPTQGGDTKLSETEQQR